MLAHKFGIPALTLALALSSMEGDDLQSSTGSDGRNQFDTAQKCSCATVPWKPDPPCVKSCSGLLLGGVTVEDLAKTLQLSKEVTAAIWDYRFSNNRQSWPEPSGLKDPPKSRSERSEGAVTPLDRFLNSSAGKEFLAAAGNASDNDLKTLVSVAERAVKK